MNIVACDKPCLHQKDGYCTLEKVPYITSSKEKGCLYYQKGSLGENKEMLPAHILKSLRNRPESD